MKTCTKCNQEQPFTSFNKDKKARDGLFTHCKTCRAVYTAKYRHNNREALAAKNAEYRHHTKAAKAAYNAEYLNDPAKYLRRRAEIAFINGLVRATKFNDGVKPFIGAEEKELMISFLMAARTLTETTGIEFDVDHIIPISKGGEHRLSNLQCITAADNRAKANKLDFNNYTQTPSYPRPEHIAACEAVGA